jgi:DNA-binding transcriptional LysR family regulator
MDMRQLTTFRTLATTLSFTQTAATLNYVQSTVTAQIQALEAELGVQLFDRLGKRVILTAAGQRLLEYAEKILALAEEAQHAVAGDEEPTGTLRLSAPESVCIYRLPGILREYHLRCPRVRLLFQPMACIDAPRMVSSGQVDVALILDKPLRAVHLWVEALSAEPILLVAPPEHSLTGVPRITAADMDGEPVVLTETNCSYRIAFEQTLMRAGIHPATTLEFSNVEAIKQCVMAGMGLGVLPAYVVDRELEQGRIAALNWAEADMTMQLQMIRHKDRWLSPALRAFLEVVREQLPVTPEPTVAACE